MRNIDFQGLVGVDEPLRIARRLSVDLECEKTPRVCTVGEGMRDGSKAGWDDKVGKGADGV